MRVGIVSEANASWSWFWSARMSRIQRSRLSTQRSRGHRWPEAYGITGHEQRSCLSRRTGCVEELLLVQTC